MHTNKKHYKISVIGKVQGVGYRAFAKSIADKLGVKGFVKNEHDGTVYMEAEAPQVTVEKFLLECHKGPQLSKVDHMDIIQVPVTDFTDFDIQTH
ncbi:acylphosphatase [uncultured Microscilla sp.]|uniref:acylphosphatase n=1 Tax=uncultured Microscilla sp. TaxID=432653 RepID=UPI00261203C6|nr:acylphosphatase [uncultured Microscilla sp.]